jgi:hypothetical protein
MGYSDGSNVFDIARVQHGMITQMKENVIPFMICPLNQFGGLGFIKVKFCRNPTLAKCGVKPNTWKSWRFGALRDSRMFRAQQQGPKHLALRCSWCHWKGPEA